MLLRDPVRLKVALTNLHADMEIKGSDSMRRIQIMKYVLAQEELHQEYAGPVLVKGNILYELDKRNADSAIALYRLAQQKHVTPYFDAYYNMGCIELERKHYEVAKRYLLTALAIQPRSMRANFNLAAAYMGMEESDMAIKYFRIVDEIEEGNAASQYKIGLIYGKQLHDLDSAVYYISRAISLDSTKAHFYEDLCVAYGMGGHYPQAIEVGLQCLRRWPYYGPVIKAVALTYERMDDTKNAEIFNKRYEALGPK